MNRRIMINTSIVFFAFFVSLSICSAFEEPPLIPVTKPTGGTTYIVGSGGDFANLEAADGNVSPGDVLRVKAGNYGSIIWNQNGSSGNPIWIEAYGDGDAIFSSSERSKIYGDWVVFDGGEDREITFTADLGLRIYGEHVTVRRCKAVDGGINNGTPNYGSNMLINGSYCHIYNCFIDNADDEGIYVNMSSDAHVYDIEIRNNVISSRGTGIQFNPHGYSGYLQGTTVVAGNFIHSGGDYYSGNRRAALVIYSRDGNFKGTLNVYNNIIYDYYYGIKAPDGGSVAGLTSNIYNNTIYKCKDSGIIIASGTGGTFVFRNNISYNNGKNDSISSSGNTIVQSNTLKTNPSFASTNPVDDDFLKLRPTSTDAIDQGADLSSEGVTDDYAGNLRPKYGGYDIGAYEYVVEAPKNLKIKSTD